MSQPLSPLDSRVSPARPGVLPADAGSSDCFHCGQPVPVGARYPVTIDGVERPMCCPGCQAVAQAIVDGGLSSYYRHRTAPARQAGPLPEELMGQLNLYDEPSVQKSFVHASGELREGALILEGITCAACIWLNERHVSALPGVVEFRVNYSTHRAHLVWDPGIVRLSDVLRAIAAIGYVAHPYDPQRYEDMHRRERAKTLRRLGVAGLGMGQAMMFAVALYAGDLQGMESGIEQLLRWASLVVATPVVLYSAVPFFSSAWRDLYHRRLGMDVPVALAIAAAYFASLWATVAQRGEVYFDSVTMFTFFLLTARYLEMAARYRATRTTEALARLMPSLATRLTEEGEQRVAAVDLGPGDRVLVRPGEPVPADGVVCEGQSTVDESLLTGESLPCRRRPGDTLVAGTLNRESPLTMTVERIGDDTVLSSIVRLLDRAQSEKPRVSQLADRAASVFVAAVLVLAAGVALWWWFRQPQDAFWITLSVLVVTCPCALSLATPAALTAATGALARMGLLVTRGSAIETLARVSHVVFDKTGTLTEGRLTLEQVAPTDGSDPQDVLEIAAALERGSEHPVAAALVRSARGRLAAADVTASPGEGVQGVVGRDLFRLGAAAFAAPGAEALPPEGQLNEGRTVVALAREAQVVAWFTLSDAIRADAASAIEALRREGVALVVMSGDDAGPVKRVAERLGINDAYFRLSPRAKLSCLQTLQRQGATVVMVGDGVNDAPVLAAAQVSIAMGSGTDLAHASADMVLLSGRLLDIPAGLRLARRTFVVIRQNLAWALLYNGLALPLAAMGFVAPWMAALGMSASSLVVVVNALRLGRRKHLPPAVAAEEQSRLRAQVA